MRKQRTLAVPAPCEAYQGAEMRRRITGCRERLRRNRAARRIAERVTPRTYVSADEQPRLALAPAGKGEREEET